MRPRMPRSRGVIVAIVAVLVAAGTLGWAIQRHQAPPPEPGTAIRLDVRGVPDGPVPAEFAPGVATMVSPADDDDPGTRMRVDDGLLTFRPTSSDAAAAYLSTPNLGAPVDQIGARFTFLASEKPSSSQRPELDGDAGSIALVVSAATENRVPQVIPPLPIHLVVTPVNWNLAVHDKGATDPLQVIAAGEFAERLVQDGSQLYDVQVSIDGPTATISLPDGKTTSVTDSRISAWRANYATFELYSVHGGTASRGAFQAVWARSGR